MPVLPIRRRLAAAAAVAALVAAPAYALAATRHGVTPTSPKARATVPTGKAVRFTGRAKGPGRVFVHVCKSAKKSKREGVICSKTTSGEATRKRGRFSYRQKVYDYPEYWLNTPGTYYWQAHRIACEGGNISDCRQEGPVVKFKVG